MALDILKDDFLLEIGGGEPLLLDNLDKTIELISQKYPKATVQFVSNYTLENKVNKLMPHLINRKIKTILKTSIDCGTRETYKKIRGRDLYDTLVNNIIKSAKNNAFDEIILKYIFLEDGSNSASKDINGFIKLAKQVKQLNPNTTTIIIDADKVPLTQSHFQVDNLPDNILKKAAQIYSVCKYDLDCKFLWTGGRLAPSTPKGKYYINRIKQQANFSLNRILYLLRKFITIIKIS